MATPNPYASFLGDRDPVEVISSTAARLQSLCETLGSARVEQSPAPGKWSPREILCHLADCEIVFAFRIRQTLAEDRHVIQPFDQELWAKTYAAYDANEALSTFATVRQWNLSLIRNLPVEVNSRTLSHPERGDMTFRTLIQTMGGHDLNHLGQMETIASR